MIPVCAQLTILTRQARRISAEIQHDLAIALPI